MRQPDPAWRHDVQQPLGPPPAGGNPAQFPGVPAPPSSWGRPKAHAGLAMAAGILGVIAAGLLITFVIYNITTAIGPWSAVVQTNVFLGLAAAALLLVAAGLTLARNVIGAWTLCVFGLICALGILFNAPLLHGQDLGTHLKFVFGFEKSSGIVLALFFSLSVLMAVVAALAGAMRSPGNAMPAPPAPAPNQPWPGA